MSNHNAHQFATTQWTLVWEASKEDSKAGRPALEEIIRRYWEPLYGFARRRGLSREDAEDATQDFLESLVSGDLLETADPARGKFRAFLLQAWRRFLVDNFRKKRAIKRGGNARTLSLDFVHGERRWQELESREPDPDRLFNLTWANSLLDEVRGRLHERYSSKERAQVLRTLLPRLTDSLARSEYERLAEQLSINASAVKVAMHRLRERFGQTLREVVSETIDNSDDIDSELNELLQIMSGR